MKKINKINTWLYAATFMVWTSAHGQSEAPVSSNGGSGTPPSVVKAPDMSKEIEATRENILRAFKKEFVFLDNESTALKSRIAELKSEIQNQKSTTEKIIIDLEQKFLGHGRDIQEKNESLKRLEQKLQDIEQSAEMVDSTLLQSSLVLEKYGVQSRPTEGEEQDKTAKIQRIDAHFSQAALLLKELNKTSVSQGEFFLADGRKTTGTIVKIGQIASFATSAEGGGTLAPSGSKQLKIIETKTHELAKSLAEGRQPRMLPMYLYENLQKPAEIHKEKTPSEVVRLGGPIAYVIVYLGFAALALIVLRCIFLWISSSNTRSLMRNIMPLVQQKNINEAVEICKQRKGAAARVLATTLRNLKNDPDHLEDIISESILHETPALDRFEAIINVMAAVAPLLGLLGTVTGMIATFDIITIYGTGEPKLLSGGISEALITTELGLIVAIPVLMISNMLSGWSQNILSGMEKVALRVLNVYKGYEPVS